MASFAHVGKDGEPALDVLVTVEVVVKVGQITHHVLGNALNPSRASKRSAAPG